MAYNQDLANRIRSALAHIPDVDERRMFGGLTFMVNNKMCISIGQSRIMARIDPALHDELIKKPGVQTAVMGGRIYKGYVHISQDALENQGSLDYWINLALDYNPRAKSSIKKGN